GGGVGCCGCCPEPPGVAGAAVPPPLLPPPPELTPPVLTPPVVGASATSVPSSPGAVVAPGSGLGAGKTGVSAASAAGADGLAAGSSAGTTTSTRSIAWLSRRARLRGAGPERTPYQPTPKTAATISALSAQVASVTLKPLRVTPWHSQATGRAGGAQPFSRTISASYG